MVLLGWHLIALTTDALPPLVRTVEPGTPGVPEPTPIRVENGERWRVDRVPTPPVLTGAKVTTTVSGRRVTLRGTDALPWVTIRGRGRDGSLLLVRDSRGDDRGVRTTAWLRGEETILPDGISQYRDRTHYAAASVTDLGPGDYPLSAPEAFAIEGGAIRELGVGWIRAWEPDGVTVLEVPVDDAGRPSGHEFTTGTTTRIVWRGQEWRVRGYGFVGRGRDGTVVLVGGAQADPLDERFAALRDHGTSREGDGRILEWRAGRFVSHRRMPDGWEFAGFSPDGWILARRAPAPAPVPSDPAGGSDAEYDAWEARQEASASDGARDWTVGVVRGGTLTPVTFPRPEGTRALPWTGGGYEYGPAAFRFRVHEGDFDRAYRVARP